MASVYSGSSGWCSFLYLWYYGMPLWKVFWHFPFWRVGTHDWRLVWSKTFSKMACFISSSNSEESLQQYTWSTVFGDDEVLQKKMEGRAKRIPVKVKLRDTVTMLSISKEEERLQKSMLNIMYGTLYTAQKPNLHVIVVHVSQVPTAPVTYNVHPRNPWQQLTCTVVHANCQLRLDSLTVLTVHLMYSCHGALMYPLNHFVRLPQWRVKRKWRASLW